MMSKAEERTWLNLYKNKIPIENRQKKKGDYWLCIQQHEACESCIGNTCVLYLKVNKGDLKYGQKMFLKILRAGNGDPHL